MIIIQISHPLLLSLAASDQAAVDRQSGPRPESRHLRQPALEGLTNSARTETPRQADRNKSDHGKRQRTVAAGGGAMEEADGVRL
ncbi:hypothetical protein F511_15009 [Dorcoceras hygrometricum]|uniref:Uncharacterized protein n=1 Tax=Dorcoceras hygrometricum TaxID=472368 RepID=A0A2Z7D9N3_9LAMI|nr:hypothetical protein F511_15009 [Dorcoceras hygrometricum]